MTIDSSKTITTIRECMPESNTADMELMVKGYLTIWNNEENLRYLSYSGQLFQEKQVRFFV